MSIFTNLGTSYPENYCYWYESHDGLCKIQKPTLIHMGEDKPLHLLFPTHWSESLSILPNAQNQARNLDAILVIMLYGEISLEKMIVLVIEFASAKILPLWVGGENRSKFDQAIAMIVSGQFSQN